MYLGKNKEANVLSCRHSLLITLRTKLIIFERLFEQYAKDKFSRFMAQVQELPKHK